jgi:hypothetical protein
MAAVLLEDLAAFAEEAGKAKAMWDAGTGAVRQIYDVGSGMMKDVSSGYATVKRRFSDPPSRRPVPRVPVRRGSVPQPRIGTVQLPTKRNRSGQLIVSRRRKSKKPRKYKYSGLVTGSYQGPFRRLKNRRRYDPFRTQGSTFKLEHQWASTGANVAEVGHSCFAPNPIFQSVGRSIIRKMFSLYSRIITDFNDFPSPASETYTYSIVNRDSVEVAALNIPGATAFSVGKSYNQMAYEIMDAILALYTTTNDHMLIEYIQFNGADGLRDLPLRQSTIHMKIDSVLTVQNITESASGGTEDHTNINDVRRNPVIGRGWFSKTNAFIPATGDGSDPGFVNNTADKANGFLGNASSTMLHPGAPNFYQNAKRSGQVILGPGRIKKSVLKKYYNTRFNAFMRIMHRFLQAETSVSSSGVSKYVGTGPSRLYHFEHMVKNASDPNVKLGCEINLFVKSYIRYFRKRECRRLDA